jgi:hypothetical protein
MVARRTTGAGLALGEPDQLVGALLRGAQHGPDLFGYIDRAMAAITPGTAAAPST